MVDFESCQITSLVAESYCESLGIERALPRSEIVGLSGGQLFPGCDHSANARTDVCCIRARCTPTIELVLSEGFEPVTLPVKSRIRYRYATKACYIVAPPTSRYIRAVFSTVLSSRNLADPHMAQQTSSVAATIYVSGCLPLFCSRRQTAEMSIQFSEDATEAAALPSYLARKITTSCASCI